MEKLIAMSDLFGISLDELVLDKAPEPVTVVQPVKAGVYSEVKADIKEKVLTDDNKKKAKKGLKIAALIAGALILIDAVTFVVYVCVCGFPK